VARRVSMGLSILLRDGKQAQGIPLAAGVALILGRICLTLSRVRAHGSRRRASGAAGAGGRSMDGEYLHGSRPGSDNCRAPAIGPSRIEPDLPGDRRSYDRREVSPSWRRGVAVAAGGTGGNGSPATFVGG